MFQRKNTKGAFQLENLLWVYNRGPAWTCVDLRGPSGHLRAPSWTFVDLRGTFGAPSWTFVDLRGWASNLRGAAWDLRGGSWTFVLIQPRLGGPRGVGADLSAQEARTLKASPNRDLGFFWK